MKKPLIGVIPLFDEAKNSDWMIPGYMEGLAEAGAFPVMLPLTEDKSLLEAALTYCDGILFTGGQDVDPALYGEEPTALCGAPCPQRDTMEEYLFHRCLSLDKPALGICRGNQLFNVLSGGSLYQDIPTETETSVNHEMKPPYHRGVHRVTIVKGTLLYDILQTESVAVNSYHHQGVKEVASSLRVAAIAEDGMVESLCRPDKTFFMAVQWHPELDFHTNELSKKLFRAFVARCR